MQTILQHMVCLLDTVADTLFMTQLFTVYSHHRNVSIIYATHHPFLPNRHVVVLTRNADYLVLLSSPCDTSAICTLSYQCMPKHCSSDFLSSEYEIATTSQGTRGCLICDWTPETPHEYRFCETLECGEPSFVIERRKLITKRRNSARAIK